MGEFRMPSLGADMEHGKMVEWLVKPGDFVHRGDVVAVVDTDKTVMDVETFEEGVVAELLVDVGATVPIGTPLARITQTPDDGRGGPGGGSLLRWRRGSARRGVGAPVLLPCRSAIWPTSSGWTVKIRGTGKHGAVTRADVEGAAAQHPAKPVPAPLPPPWQLRPQGPGAVLSPGPTARGTARRRHRHGAGDGPGQRSHRG